jgi:2-polyprenyl-3-methyl-5-hydroxy-6-metoxy-1,4-benzoquinol methylase
MVKLRIHTEAELKHVEDMINDLDDAAVIAEILIRDYNVDKELTDYLIEIGGTGKVREFWHECLKYDLLNGTRTTSYISEDTYKQRAAASPGEFDAPEAAIHGVKHRPSLTSSIVDPFTRAHRLLQRHGLSAENATVFDLGCGEGKPVLIARSGQLGFQFKKAVGIDYYGPVLETARQNAKTMGLTNVEFKRFNAADFETFNGINVIYMYNPFDESIMRAVAKNIRAKAGTAIVCYTKPLHADCFSSRYGWKQHNDLVIGTQSDNPAEQDRHTMFFSRNL